MTSPLRNSSSAPLLNSSSGSALRPSSSSGSLEVTRLGPIRKFEPKFTKEERFRWMKPRLSSDVIYDVRDVASSRRIFFGTATRGEDSVTVEAKKRTNGPGSYEVLRSIDRLSDYHTRSAYRFGNASRESMVVKTPSPGAIYNIKNVYWNGPDDKIAIGFNCDRRKPLYTSTTSVNAEPVYPKLPQGPAISMGKKLKQKPKSSDVPGPIYDVQVICK